MLVDPKVETHVEANILRPEGIRRLANGSIYYTYYDRRARTCRGRAFRAAARRVAGLIRRVFGRRRNGRQGTRDIRVPGIEIVAAGRSEQRDDECGDRAGPGHWPLCDAA